MIQALNWLAVIASLWAAIAGVIGIRAVRTRADDYKRRTKLHREQISRITDKLSGK